MKRLILFELIILFLTTTFESDSPPGWFQQVLPVSDLINDIYFLDSSTGLICTAGASSSSDTGYVMKTTNGGSNWLVQFQSIASFNAIQFTDNSTGYSVGSTGFGKIWKTINGGINWSIQFNFSANPINDLSFVNKDTGWICSDDPFGGGIFKTTNGGVNWQSQLGPLFFIKKLFFLNKDTGWAENNESSGKLYRTTNGGTNWVLQYTFPQQRNDVFFRNGNLGWASGGATYKTTDGGFNWVASNDGGIALTFVNDSVGWGGNNLITIIKTTNAGNNWFRQLTNANNPSAFAIDTLEAWAGGNKLMHTTDGGGPPVGITHISNEIPTDYKLYQNYPNPFNAMTKLKFQMSKQGYALIKLFDVTGREVSVIVNEKLNTGEYEIIFDANNLSSGVYFYSLYADGKIIATKKMVLIK